MKNEIFMWRMKAKEICDHFREASEEGIGHGVTNRDITDAFNKADDLYEILHTIESKLEDNEA